MDQNAPNAGARKAAYEAALAEERLLWRALSNAGLSGTEWVLAYARWRAAAQRLKALAPAPKGRLEE